MISSPSFLHSCHYHRNHPTLPSHTHLHTHITQWVSRKVTPRRAPVSSRPDALIATPSVPASLTRVCISRAAACEAWWKKVQRIIATSRSGASLRSFCVGTTICGVDGRHRPRCGAHARCALPRSRQTSSYLLAASCCTTYVHHMSSFTK